MAGLDVKKMIRQKLAENGIKAVAIEISTLRSGTKEYFVDLPDDVEEKASTKAYQAIMIEMKKCGKFVRMEPQFGDADKLFYIWSYPEDIPDLAVDENGKLINPPKGIVVHD